MKEASSYTFALKYNNFQVLKHAHSACGEDKFDLPLSMGSVDYHGLTCPTAGPGSLELNVDASVSSVAPSGKYTAELRALDHNGENLLCINVEFKL